MKQPPRELIFDSPIDFRMDLEATEDGERIIRERNEQMADKRRNEQNQKTLNLE